MKARELRAAQRVPVVLAVALSLIGMSAALAAQGGGIGGKRPIDPETGEFVPEPIDRDDLDMQLPVEFQPAPSVPIAPERALASPTVKLHDNGPFVNCPGCGVLGAEESVLQNDSLGMTTIGYGHRVSANFWIADDFRVTDPAGWTIGTVQTFAYQTGSTAIPTLDDMRIRIWDGPPGDPGSTVIFDSAATNRFREAAWTGAYRVSETTSGTATNRPIMRAIAPVNVYLPAATYWLDWQLGGTLASGPWAPPITVDGQSTTGNALWSTDGSGVAYGPVIDSGSATQQGFPFELHGRVGDAGDIVEVVLRNTASAGGVEANRITVAQGTEVVFKWRHVNVGTVPLELHDLADSEFGAIFHDLYLPVAPGQSWSSNTSPPALNETTINETTWTAFNPGPTDVTTSTDTATVIVSPPEPLLCNGPMVDFDLGIPSDWSVVNSAPGNPVVWSNLGGCGEAANYASSGDAACASSRLQGGGSGLYDTALVSPPFSLVGADRVFVSYQANYQNFAGGDLLDVEISLDGGTTWGPLSSWNEDHGSFRSEPGDFAAIDLSPYAGLENLRLRWRYHDPLGPQAALDWYAQIDDVFLGCDQTLGVCTVLNLPIPDNDPAGAQTSRTATFSGQIQDLDVYLQANHTWVGDLVFSLEHVDTGTTVTFIDRPGVPLLPFGCSGSDIEATIDDEAGTDVESACAASVPTIEGRFVGGDPADPSLLAAFDGESLQGTWTLRVSDHESDQTGAVTTWCLETSLIRPDEGCPGLSIADKTYDGAEVLEACDWIDIGPDVTVMPGAILEATSGAGIRLANGISFSGEVTLGIDPGLRE